MEQIRVYCETNKEFESVLKVFESMGVNWRSGSKATIFVDNHPVPCYIYWHRDNYLLFGKDAWDHTDYKNVSATEFLRRFSHTKTIVVYQKDASTVVAVEKSGEKVLKSAKAKCSPFDFQICAQLALDRLFTKRKIIKQKVYDVGDKVLIKSWEEMEKEYGLVGQGINCRCVFIREMEKYCETVMTIKELTLSGNYFMHDQGYLWSTDMIKGRVIEE